jgi:hypothetical protein
VAKERVLIREGERQPKVETRKGKGVEERRRVVEKMRRDCKSRSAKSGLAARMTC